MDKQLEYTLKICFAADENSWNLLTLKNDDLFRFFTPEQVRDIIVESSACGKREAQRLKNEMPGLGNDAAEYVKALGLSVVLKENMENKNIVTFAKYGRKKISLNQNIVHRIDTKMRQYGGSQRFGPLSAASLLTAHELYHYLEDRDKTLVTCSMKIQIVQIGFWKRKITPRMAGEIGAFSFAKELAGISYHPRILEILGGWDNQRTIVQKMTEELRVVSSSPITGLITVQ